MDALGDRELELGWRYDEGRQSCDPTYASDRCEEVINEVTLDASYVLAC
jgi:hypothetical protein